MIEIGDGEKNLKGECYKVGEFQPIRFGKYLLLDKIASGGMAELYRAKITGVEGFEKLLAIKRIHPHLSTEEELIKAFIDEAKLAALLNHQCTIQVYDFGNVGPSYFIAMEYLFGRDLRRINLKAKIKCLPLSLDYCLHIVSRICAGLDYAHSLKDFRGKPLNLVHRDISPQNIIATFEGEVKIVDFGIAKAASRSVKTQVGMIKGKVAYMSPEQAEGKEIDYRSDIFATGILLYEMATGKRMFKGDTLYVLSKVREADFKPPELVAPDLPPKLFEILHRALARQPQERYQSCGDMQADLEECIHECGFKPSAKGLSRYMKELFADEIQKEYDTLKNAAAYIPEKKHSGDAPPQKRKTLKSTGLFPTGGPKKGKSKKIGIPFLSLIAGVVFSAVLLFALWPEDKTSVKVEERKIATEMSRLDKMPAGEIVQAPERPEVPETGDIETPESMAPAGSAEPAPGTPTVENPPERIALAQAREALDMNDFSTAIVLFEDLLNSHPEMLDEISKPYSAALEKQAGALMVENPEKSMELLLKAVEINPVSETAYASLGFLHVNMKNYEKAADAYEIATSLDPMAAEVFFNLGYVYAVTGDYANAEKMYAHVVSLGPVYMDEALYNLAVMQHKQGKTRDSIENLERAIAVNPDNETAKKYIRKLKQTPGEIR